VSTGATKGRTTAGQADAAMDVETFLAPWPAVLTQMKDFVDLWFLALGRKRQAQAVRVFISRTLVSQAQLQPHAREFKASIARIPCRIELKATGEPAHRIEIDYRR
jgi:hypothetical protein